jgi:hypothetical protein
MAYVSGTHPRLMRSLLACVLSGLLIATTPIGTGHGVHQGELLHLVLPHLHFVGGHLVTHDEAEQAAAAAHDGRPREPRAGPALGAGSGADGAGLSLAMTPTLPRYAVLLPSQAFGWLRVGRSVSPPGILESPPDPPPQLTA